MNPNDVIDTYIDDVTRRLPAGDRNGIALELRGLLAEMLDDRAATAGRPADDAMVMDLLRGFGTPAQVAARYRTPGEVIIPPEQTRTFALLSVIGMLLQWALTLPRVFTGEQPIVAWWFGAGLGAFWWPGFLVTMALLGLAFRRLRSAPPVITPRQIDADRVHRGALAFGLAGAAFGTALMISLPWLAPALPGPLPQILAFDPEFLRVRAWPVVILWAGSIATLVAALRQGRWTPALRRWGLILNAGFLVLLTWWLVGGNIFQASATDAGARVALGLVMVFIAIDVAITWRRRLRAPRLPDPAR